LAERKGVGSGRTVDASLVSIMLIVLISSALVVFSFAHEKITSPVVLLKDAFPERIYSQASVTTKERMDFSFSVAARRSMRRLEIQYTTLIQADPVLSGGNMSGEASASDFAMRVAPIRALLRETSNEHLGHDELPVEAEFGGNTLSGVLYDFPLLRLYADPSTSDRIYTSYLVLKNGTEFLYFEGISDFFINRRGGYVDVELPEEDVNKSSISIMRIRRNGNTTTYSSAPDAPADWRGMDEVPPFGRIIFTDVEKHDTFSVDFTVDIPRRPKAMSAQVIRVYGDGQDVETVLNLMG